MKLPSTSNHSRGFTLFEILIVMGMLVLLATLGLFISMDVYRGNSLSTERDIIISVLQKARSRAINNINEVSHGVRFDPDEYVIFEGTSCTVAGDEFEKSKSVANTGGCVVFNQLTGSRDTINSTVNSLTISGQGYKSIITINDEGRISW